MAGVRQAGRPQIFREARSTARRRAIREAKNTWFLRKAEEIERERFGGKKVWKDIRDMQQGRKELLPSRSAVIPDEEGALATVRTLTTRDGAGTSPRFLTSRAYMMQRCWNQ